MSKPQAATAGSEIRFFNSRLRDLLLRMATPMSLKPRKLIYREGSRADWVFAISTGFVKCYRDLPSGKRSVSSFLFPEDIFGLAENGRYLHSAETITRSTLYRLPLDSAVRLVKQDGDLQFEFLTKVTHQLCESHRRAMMIGRHDAVGRLAMFVTLMHERVPAISPNHREVFLPMTRSDIASFLALCPETITRAAAELEHRGIVRFKNRHLVRILDAGQLAMLAAAM